MKGYIYTLSCSKSGNIFYVGCTTVSLKNRLSGHKSLSKTSGNNLYEYISKNKVSPIIEEVEAVNCKNKYELLRIEEFWIEQFRQWGFDLKNSSNNTPSRYVSRNEEGTGSVKIEPNLILDAASYCKDNGIKITFYVTEAVKEKLAKDRSK